MVNPWADVLTLTRAWCVSKKHSRALISLPKTEDFQDLVVFNSGKFYGRQQLANLFTNWKQVPENYDYFNTMKKLFRTKKVRNCDVIGIFII